MKIPLCLSDEELSKIADLYQLSLADDKPDIYGEGLCLKPENGRELVNLAERKKLVNQVGHHNRFVGVFQEVKRLLDRWIIGDVYHLTGEAYGQVVIKEKSSTWRSSHFEGGGCLYDYAAYVIDLINYLIGPPGKVVGTVLKKTYSKDVDDAVYATLLYKNGKSSQISMNWSDEMYRRMSTQLTIMGTRGTIIADRQECKVYLQNSDETENREEYTAPHWR